MCFEGKRCEASCIDCDRVGSVDDCLGERAWERAGRGDAQHGVEVTVRVGALPELGLMMCLAVY